MPSEVFSKHTFNKVANLIRKTVAKKVKYADKDCSGLAIIVSPTVASWYISTRDMNLCIAPFNQFGYDDLDKLRKFVGRARAEKKVGKDIDVLVKAFAKTGSINNAVVLHDVEHNGALKWEAARDLFLEYVRQEMNPDTYRGYKSSLGVMGLAKDFEPISNMALAAITTADLATVRDNITDRAKRGDAKGAGVRQANYTVMAIKAAFRHFINRRQTFGISLNPAQELEKSDVRDPNQRKLKNDRALTQMEIGSLIYALEECKNEIVRNVLMLQLFTGQRRFTPTSALVENFTKHPNYGYTWTFEDKSHAWRVLPLTPDLCSLIQRAVRTADSYGSPFLFPQQRVKKKGELLDSHINERTVSKEIERMRGVGKVFGDLNFSVATHDLRRTFITHMKPKMGDFFNGKRQLEPDDVEMITHKNEGRDTVSALRYDKNAYLDVKLQILETWATFCYEGYHMYIAHLESKKQPPRLAA